MASKQFQNEKIQVLAAYLTKSKSEGEKIPLRLSSIVNDKRPLPYQLAAKCKVLGRFFRKNKSIVKIDRTKGSSNFAVLRKVINLILSDTYKVYDAKVKNESYEKL